MSVETPHFEYKLRFLRHCGSYQFKAKQVVETSEIHYSQQNVFVQYARIHSVDSGEA